jgi:ferredoxin
MLTRRNLFRLALLIAFALLALGYVPEKARPWSVALPALSPLLGLCGAAASGAFSVLTLAALPLLVAPLFWGRFFCWRLCPMGFLAQTVSRLNKRNAGLVRRVPYLGKALALLIVGSALAGYPVLLWADPLCVFNGFFAAWRQPLAWASGVTAIGFVLILLASLVAPNVWCHRLCPLGGLGDLLNRVRPVRPPAEAPDAFAENVRLRRRSFLTFACGYFSARVYGRFERQARRSDLIRPPGAASRAFNAVCARCGNCMKACPYNLIVPDLGSSGLDGLFTPVLKFRSQNPDQEQFCFQDCTACTQVCPTGALRSLKTAEKQQTAIGLARVDKKACIAWEKGEYCVVCQEFCPYQAIIEVEHRGVKCPIVDEDKCRGCGACESQCPGLPIAILVEGRNPQPLLTEPSPALAKG